MIEREKENSIFMWYIYLIHFINFSRKEKKGCNSLVFKVSNEDKEDILLYLRYDTLTISDTNNKFYKNFFVLNLHDMCMCEREGSYFKNKLKSLWISAKDLPATFLRALLCVYFIINLPCHRKPFKASLYR